MKYAITLCREEYKNINISSFVNDATYTDIVEATSKFNAVFHYLRELRYTPIIYSVEEII